MDGKFSNRVTGIFGLLLSLFLITTTAFQCEREKDPEFVLMTFVVPITIEPLSADFKLGDTLWVRADFSETMKELNSQTDYILSDFDFKSKIGLLKLLNPNTNLGYQPSATDDIIFFPKIGSIPFVGETFSPFNFSFKNNRYQLKIGLVPKKTGVYAINFLPPGDAQDDLQGYIELGFNSSGQKRIPQLEFLFFEINEGNTNFDLFKLHCKAESINNPLPINIYYEQKGTFTFEVK
jgi:hypothetical protein